MNPSLSIERIAQKQTIPPGSTWHHAPCMESRPISTSPPMQPTTTASVIMSVSALSIIDLPSPPHSRRVRSIDDQPADAGQREPPDDDGHGRPGEQPFREQWQPEPA